MNTTAIIVLAGGKGRRMGSEIPKPLVELGGKPVIKHLLQSIEDSKICDKLVIVVGDKAKIVKEALGPDYTYVLQSEQLGTGHAVSVCRENLEGVTDSVIVLYADHPFVDSDTVKSLSSLQKSSGAVMSMATVTVPDFEDWRLPMYSYGRVIRNENKELVEIIEKKDATDEELLIREVSPAFYCFDANWLWKNIKELKNENVQGEYYLTDLVEMAFNQESPVTSMNVDLRTAMGINTKEELELAKNFITT